MRIRTQERGHQMILTKDLRPRFTAFVLFGPRAFVHAATPGGNNRSAIATSRQARRHQEKQNPRVAGTSDPFAENRDALFHCA